MTLQPRPASEAANCDPYAIAARDPAARSCTWDGILSRSVAEAQCPHARIAAFDMRESRLKFQWIAADA